MNKKRENPIRITKSSGNVFKDLKCKNPDEKLAKANLAILIQETINKRKLTQKQAAILMGIDQPKISHIFRGRLSGFTIERLMRFLTALGLDIFIETKEHKTKKAPPSIQVLIPKPQSGRRLSF